MTHWPDMAIDCKPLNHEKGVYILISDFDVIWARESATPSLALACPG